MPARVSSARAFALGLGGLTVLYVAILVSAERIRTIENRPSVTVEDISLDDMPGMDEPWPQPAPEAQPTAEAAQESQATSKSGRVAATEGVPAYATDTQGLQREEPQAAPAPAAPADAGEPEKLLYRPAVSAAGRIEAQGYRIEIAGIIPVEADEQCSASGTDWPCGAAARTQFRNFIRNRAVSCKVPETAPDAAVTTSCSLGGEDLGSWLVAQGWARAADDGPYSQVAAKAEEDRRGIYGSRPVLPPMVIERAPTLGQPSSPSIISPPPAPQNAPSPSITQGRGFFPPAPAAPVQ